VFSNAEAVHHFRRPPLCVLMIWISVGKPAFVLLQRAYVAQGEEGALMPNSSVLSTLSVFGGVFAVFGVIACCSLQKMRTGGGGGEDEAMQKHFAFLQSGDESMLN
jgi:hypothetical protein